MKKEKSELIQEALDTLQTVTLSWRSTEGYVAELFEDIRNLEEENKKLKERVSELEDVSEDYDLLSKDFITLWEENEKLKEEIRFLEECLDNKEKVNKSLREDLSECECSLWYENDEVWFWKREYKRLKQRIKEHCKWYWNLFPEDEMKRQWKKADKKRKKSDLYKDVWLMEEDTLQELRDIGEI